MADHQNQYRGSMLGLAIGDALGLPTEFLGLDEIRRRFGPDGVTDLTGRQALFTDDTEMSLATARALLEADSEDVEAVMATMSPSMDRLTPEVVECEHEAVFAQADATLVVDAEANETSGARGYEVSDADGEVRDSGTITFVFADDGLLNATTFPVEIGLDFGVDFSACAPTE